MSGRDLVALAPFLAAGATAVALVLSIAVRRSRRAGLLLCVGGLALSAAAIPLSAGSVPRVVGPLLQVDGYARFFSALFLLATLAVAILADGYLAGRREPPGEFHLLLVLGALGAMVMSASRHFASLLLGLETLGVALYGLIAYTRTERRSVEAGIKYLILAGASSAVLLFGAALLYAETGSLDPGIISHGFHGGAEPWASSLPLVAGLGLLICGAAFKLALVPFHLWTADVYQGAPAPAAAWIATVSKGAMFAFLLRYLGGLEGFAGSPPFLALVALAAASMIAGNLLALLQDRVKRLLGYSSIAHMGYLMVALLAGEGTLPESAAFYLAAYTVTMLGAFGVLSVLEGPGDEPERIEDLRGLLWRRPWIAALFTACLLSLAGLPLTAGFIGKLYLMAAGVGSALWGLVLVMAAGSALGLFYYLRVIVAMMSVEEAEGGGAPPVPAAAGVVLGLLLGAQIWMGVYPPPLQRLASRAANPSLAPAPGGARSPAAARGRAGPPRSAEVASVAGGGPGSPTGPVPEGGAGESRCGTGGPDEGPAHAWGETRCPEGSILPGDGAASR